MGRPSKLTPEQWADLFQRAEKGEPQKKLAAEYGVSAGLVSKAISQLEKSVKPAVNTVLEGERQLRALTPGERVAAESILDVRRSIMAGIAESAHWGSLSAAHLQRVAHRQFSRVKGDGEGGVLSAEERQAAQDGGALTKIANEALQPALRIVEAELKREVPKNDLLSDKSDDELVDELNAAEERLIELEGEGE